MAISFSQRLLALKDVVIAPVSGTSSVPLLLAVRIQLLYSPPAIKQDVASFKKFLDQNTSSHKKLTTLLRQPLPAPSKHVDDVEIHLVDLLPGQTIFDLVAGLRTQFKE